MTRPIQTREQCHERLALLQEAVKKRFGDIPMRQWVFEYHDAEFEAECPEVKLPHIWELECQWTMVPTVTEPVKVTLYSMEDTKAVTVWHEPHRVKLELDEPYDLAEVEKALIAALEKHEPRRMEIARKRALEVAPELLPFLDELQYHRERSQRHAEAERELRMRFKEHHEYDEHVKAFVQDALSRLGHGMSVYSARLDRIGDGLMLGFDVLLSYPWPG